MCIDRADLVRQAYMTATVPLCEKVKPPMAGGLQYTVALAFLCAVGKRVFTVLMR